jgi:hypothetical protein
MLIAPTSECERPEQRVNWKYESKHCIECKRDTLGKRLLVHRHCKLRPRRPLPACRPRPPGLAPPVSGDALMEAGADQQFTDEIISPFITDAHDFDESYEYSSDFEHIHLEGEDMVIDGELF